MRLPYWLTRPGVRKAHCVDAGTHRPVFVSNDHSKVCTTCWTW